MWMDGAPSALMICGTDDCAVNERRVADTEGSFFSPAVGLKRVRQG